MDRTTADLDQCNRRAFLRRAAAAGLVAAAAPAALHGQGKQNQPNIVLIISDDHGWTDYGFMGHQVVQTPCLDRLARQSLVFRRAYVPSSLCCPSLASIITGLYPHQHKITCNDPPGTPAPGGGGKKAGDKADAKKAAADAQKAFAQGREAMNKHLEAVDTLPRLLAKRGYLSLQTGKWWQGDYRRGGFTQGMTHGQRHGDEGLDIGRKTMTPIFDFMDSARKEDKPFFVWYAPMLPHQPHNPPAALLEKYRPKTDSIHLARYYAMVEWFDQTCGQLLDHLDKTGLAENTIVLYLADNGWTQDPAAPRPLRSKLTPYDAGLRTPIMVRWPGKVQPRMLDERAMSIDLAPTVLAALGEKPTPAMQGINLLDDKALAGRKTICGECFVHTAVDLDNPARNLVCRWIIDERHKLILPFANGHPKSLAGQTLELYDIPADPYETKNLAAERPEIVKALTEKLDAWWKP